MADPAPLIATAEAPVPAGGTAEWLRGADGSRFRAAFFPVDRPRGSVVLNPGRTEPIEKYFEVVDDLRGRGFAVLTHDWRGQGLSDRPLPDRLKGHAKGWTGYLSDHRLLLDAFEARAPRPWIAVGHSMGGCLTLLALAEGERRPAGAVLSAPMLKVSTGERPYAQARVAAWLMARLGRASDYVLGRPNSPHGQTFETDALTSDRARFERWRGQLEACPDLGLGGATWGWLDFAFRATARLARGPGLKTVAVPVTVAAAGADTLVDNAGLRAVTARLPRGRYVEIPGARHEILIETDDKRAQWFAEFDRLADRLTSPSA